jgi:hypothetical protein
MIHQHVFHVLRHLDYIPVIVTTIIGFIFGGLWYSTPVFGKAWKEETKLTDEQCKGGSARKMILTLLCTLVAATAIDVLIIERGLDGLVAGAKFGLFLGIGLGAALNIPAALFECRTCRYKAIVIGHAVLLCVLMAAILGAWH